MNFLYHVHLPSLCYSNSDRNTMKDGAKRALNLQKFTSIFPKVVPITILLIIINAIPSDTRFIRS